MIINDEIILITGGASGMGRATADYLKAQGAKIVIWDQTVIESADYLSIACDVSQEASVDDAFSKTVSALGTPRVLIQCAGVAPAKKMFGKSGLMPLDAFEKVININLVGTFNVMRLLSYHMAMLAPHALSGERGVIINTASIAAYEGQIGQMAYSASKGGVVAMTLTGARELAEHAIRVNTIAPGLIATPMLLNMPEAVQDSLAAGVPFPKRFGKPDEFARLAAHLIENELINGETIRLDGGLRMQAR
jgi:NAD(P)-dependent dehydrogenase (short-subunit alcohol dehydrogenase family)